MGGTIGVSEVLFPGKMRYWPMLVCGRARVCVQHASKRILRMLWIVLQKLLACAHMTLDRVLRHENGKVWWHDAIYFGAELQ